ncbi:MAG: hypothetical protein NVSMB5_11570 [Candidatus Velthaea sp.]
MSAHPGAAPHLAQIDARYETTITALHARANAAKAIVRSDVESLQAALPAPPVADIEEPPPYAAPPPNPYAEHALIPDAPIVPPVLGDDGMPLWQD